MLPLIREIRHKTKPVLGAGLAVLFPPRCLACDGFVETQGTLCSSCWDCMNFITEPFCPCCGYPYDSAEKAGLLCGSCLQEAPEFTTARSVLKYDEHSKKLILGLKYADRTQGVPAYARWLARVGREALAGSDLIIPVPLHPLRLVARRFNQSALLAKGVSQASGVAFHPDLLVRARRTPPQAGLTRRQRQQNVAGAFHVPARRREMIAGKRIVLIDDVVTTQATVNQCARMLKQAGAREVHVLSLAYATASD